MRRQERINDIKSRLFKSGIDIYIIPTEDPHLSEYPADHWKLREFVSGFTGSNGLLALSTQGNFLWTDSRYYLQAEKELHGTDIQLRKEESSPSWIEWVGNFPTEKATIGINGRHFSQTTVEKLQEVCEKKNFILKDDICMEEENLLPPLPSSPLFILEEKYCGMTFSEKRNLIFHRCPADYVLLCSLEEIAWTFNLRATDTAYTPIALAYAILGREKSYLFVDNSKLTPEVSSYLAQNDIVCLFSYDCIFDTIGTIVNQGTILADPRKTNHALYSKIPTGNRTRGVSPIEKLKSIKNDTEISNLRNTMRKDGVALANAIFEIERLVKSNQTITETDVAHILREKRKPQQNFVCESFATIAGYGANGAIVHYNAKPDGCSAIGTDGLLLIDSGASYLDGTTDITRVFCFGTPTDEQKRDYTLVLKGHIAIATCQFPTGTSGMQIDSFARQYLWRAGMDYGHGTGHGVGFFLSVHEGPQRISKRNSDEPLAKHMLLSDEPGVYKAGRHGIRIENVIAVQDGDHTEFGDFLRFETMTLFPYEKKLIDKSLLTVEEIAWINTYHRIVFENLSPLIHDERIIRWLKKLTAALD